MVKSDNCIEVICNNLTDGSHMSDFLVTLYEFIGIRRLYCEFGCMPLPFDLATIMMIVRFVASAVGKIYKLCSDKLRELEAPWITK